MKCEKRDLLEREREREGGGILAFVSEKGYCSSETKQTIPSENVGHKIQYRSFTIITTITYSMDNTQSNKLLSTKDRTKIPVVFFPPPELMLPQNFVLSKTGFINSWLID